MIERDGERRVRVRVRACVCLCVCVFVCLCVCACKCARATIFPRSCQAVASCLPHPLGLQALQQWKASKSQLIAAVEQQAKKYARLNVDVEDVIEELGAYVSGAIGTCKQRGE